MPLFIIIFAFIDYYAITPPMILILLLRDAAFSMLSARLSRWCAFAYAISALRHYWYYAFMPLFDYALFTLSRHDVRWYFHYYYYYYTLPLSLRADYYYAIITRYYYAIITPWWCHKTLPLPLTLRHYAIITLIIFTFAIIIIIITLMPRATALTIIITLLLRRATWLLLFSLPLLRHARYYW